jgi:lipopolysaccharide transport system permease protein
VLKILWRQVRFLTKSNLKSRYRSTVAGFLWVVINPVVLFGVQSFLFKTVLKLHVTNYSVFLLSGLLPWVFFSQSITMCTGIIVGSGRLLKSFPVHALVYIMAQLLDNLVNFLAAFILIGIPVGVFANHWDLTFLLIPIPVLILFAGVTGMCFSLAVVHVFFRDTLFIVNFLIQVIFFVTPIFFPPEYIPEQYRWIIQMNFIYYLIRPFRTLLYDFQPRLFLLQSFTGALVAAVLLGISALIWKRSRNAIYFNI